jgi:hypothetical protein
MITHGMAPGSPTRGLTDGLGLSLLALQALIKEGGPEGAREEFQGFVELLGQSDFIEDLGQRVDVVAETPRDKKRLRRRYRALFKEMEEEVAAQPEIAMQLLTDALPEKEKRAARAPASLSDVRWVHAASDFCAHWMNGDSHELIAVMLLGCVALIEPLQKVLEQFMALSPLSPLTQIVSASEAEQPSSREERQAYWSVVKETKSFFQERGNHLFSFEQLSDAAELWAYIRFTGGNSVSGALRREDLPIKFKGMHRSNASKRIAQFERAFRFTRRAGRWPEPRDLEVEAMGRGYRNSPTRN